MKKLLLSALLLSLTGCGVAEDLTGHCRGFMDQYCDAILGQDPVTQDDVDAINGRIASLEGQINALQAQVNQGDSYMSSVELLITNLNTQVTSINASIAQLQAQMAANNSQDASQQQAIAALQASLASLTTQVSTLQSGQAQQQNVLNGVLARLAALETNNSNGSVISFIDPCGDGPSYDEVIMKTSTGQLMAYFEDQGRSKRFLTLLSPGQYETTDQQGCRFTVNSNGSVSW